MRLATLFGPDLHRMLDTEPEAIREALEELHEEDIAEICEELSEQDVVRLLDVLPDAFAAGVLERMPDELRTAILERVEAKKAAQLLAGMAPDEAADAVQTLDRPLRASILEELGRVSPDAADDVKELAAYAENTAGSIMTTAFVGVPPEAKVWQAMAEVRRRSKNASAETIYYVYALAYENQLVGVVSLRDLILAEPGQLVSDVMISNVVRVVDQSDREEVARTMAKYDFHALPVVDGSGKMVGVITADDVVDVIIAEATEDAHKMGAVSPALEGYFQTSLYSYWRSRVTWLVVLFLGGFLTASVMHGFQHDLERVIALAIFIPLIISTGGNAGSQSATLVIRALAMQEVTPRDWLRVAGREMVVGVALGCVVGVLGFGRAYFAGEEVAPLLLGLTVSISILAVVTVGSLLGSLLPLLIQRVGLDPAVSSTPFIASLSDVMGLLVYLGIARALLG
jgi:magnesium transporter